MFADRVRRARERMAEVDVDVLLLSVGADLPWLTGYEAMPLERLTMLVLPRDGDATMVVPRLEAPRVTEQPDVFEILPWDETDDPVGIVAKLAGSPSAVAIGDRTWARFLVDLHALMPAVTWRKGSDVTSPLRARKDAAEIAALRAASAAADRVAVQLQSGEIPLIGRTEAEVSRDLYAVLQDAQARAVDAAVVGTPCEDVDGVARRLITEGGYGPHFIHRTGHGIGLEEHEDPYLVGGNCEPLAPGHAFSIEPGIYLAGEVGARIEDIVVATDAGPESLNLVTHDLVVVDR
jgi:Xaa-Pro aminopeptidase